jgi:nucleoside-diphosphate-sugar epimerase
MALITGGAGFLGAALVRELLRRERPVRVLDDSSRGGFDRLADLAGRFEAIEGDVRDERLVKHAAQGCASVFHLAAVNGTRNFYEKPERVLDVALRGTLAAVLAARDAGARRFLFASSGEVYHEPQQVPTPEDVPLVVPDPSNPRFSYSGGKIAGELVTINWLRGTKTGAIIFRPHNVYGPAMGYEHVVPNLVAKLKEAAQSVHGKHAAEARKRAALSGAELIDAATCNPKGWPRPEVEIELMGTGKETRAFCYVDDAAEAIALLEEKGASGATYHVGKEEEVAIGDLARQIGELAGFDVTTRPGAAPAGGPLRRCADTKKLRALGFFARTPLEEGLRRALAWYWDHAEPKSASAKRRGKAGGARRDGGRA